MDNPRRLTEGEFENLKPGDEILFDVTEGDGDIPEWHPYAVVARSSDGVVEVKPGSLNTMGGHRKARLEWLAVIPGMDRPPWLDG